MTEYLQDCDCSLSLGNVLLQSTLRSQPALLTTFPVWEHLHKYSVFVHTKWKQPRERGKRKEEEEEGEEGVAEAVDLLSYLILFYFTAPRSATACKTS